MESIKYAGGTSENVTITGGAIPVLNRAVEPGHDSTLDRTWGGTKSNYLTSVTNQQVKASAGVVFGWIATATGDLELKDGNTSLGRVPITIGQVTNLPGVTFATKITCSASGASATIFYL